MKQLSETTLGILSLWLLPGMGPRRIHKLWEHFGDINAIFSSKASYIADLLGIKTDAAGAIANSVDSKELKSELQLMASYGVEAIDFTQSAYPAPLKEIHNAPPILYLKGKHDFTKGFNLAFVGSRKASFSGMSICKKLIKKLAKIKPDSVIVSGLAMGIDTVAHKTAIEVGLKTLAILANGHSTVYPAKNRGLSKSIQDNGMLITEFPMSSKPIATNFPLRNRIISGLSKGVVVVEAGERSGATITAGYALEQNRELFALPGPADSAFHKGTNRLIQRGQAKLVMDVEDILEEFSVVDSQLSFEDLPAQVTRETETLNENELNILKLIEKGICQKDRLIDQSGLSIQQLLSTLTALEIKERIISKPGALYEIVNR